MQESEFPIRLGDVCSHAVVRVEWCLHGCDSLRQSAGQELSERWGGKLFESGSVGVVSPIPPVV